jgi:hypothetical protein
MLWTDELLPAVRAMVGDDGAAATYLDAQLTTLAVVSVGQLHLAVSAFADTYTASVSTAGISPAPSAGGPDGASYQTDLALKTACGVTHGP